MRAFVFDKGTHYESVKSALDANDNPIKVREVDVKLTAQEFLALFKRFKRSADLARPGTWGPRILHGLTVRLNSRGPVRDSLLAASFHPWLSYSSGSI